MYVFKCCFNKISKTPMNIIITYYYKTYRPRWIDSPWYIHCGLGLMGYYELMSNEVPRPPLDCFPIFSCKYNRGGITPQGEVKLLHRKEYDVRKLRKFH